MNHLVACFNGPSLYRRFKTQLSPAKVYQPHALEKTGDSIISWLRLVTGVLWWTSPLLAIPMYRRGWFTSDGLSFMAKYGGTCLVLYCFGVFIRGMGRNINMDYINFLEVLAEAKANAQAPAVRRALAAYDFEFWAWPVDYSVLKSSGDGTKVRGGASHGVPALGQRWSRESLAWEIIFSPLSYLASHTFGRRMAYPGCTALVGSMVHPTLLEERAKLVESYGAQRAKVETALGNGIDTIFIDRRGHPRFEEHGHTLVLCSEGNSGFYEMGTTVTPKEAGYSVLGWNHPGFAGSSGEPWPHTERDAIDAVLQYATDRLGFPPDRIVVFAWSIGGYPAAYLAAQYPEIKALVLDATFDDILPLALPRMPESWGSLTKRTVRQYMDLNVSGLTCSYKGPLLLIRRYKDEMISTGGPDSPGTNRGNALLYDVINSRFPRLIGDAQAAAVLTLLELRPTLIGAHLEGQGVKSAECESWLVRHATDHGTDYPLDVAGDLAEDQKTKLTLYLVSKLMTQYDSTHCTPLPSALFTKPWSLEDLVRKHNAASL